MVSTDNEQTKKPKKFMSRNVTEFRHLLKMSYINENDLNWMIGLRENPPAQSLSKNCSPPEVYSKKTKLFEIREVNRLKDKPHLINGHSFGHMLLKKGEKIGGKHTEDQLQFYSQLHTGENKSIDSKSFSVYPYKDRHDLPKFLKTEFIRKTSPIEDTEKEVAIDGYHKQATYTQKILRDRNYGLLEPFVKVLGRGKVTLPGLAWQVGLRNYHI